MLKPQNWSYMQQGVVIWLNGTPSLLARRVVKDGVASRPLVGGDAASECEEGEPEYQKTVEKLETIMNNRWESEMRWTGSCSVVVQVTSCQNFDNISQY